MTESPIWAVAVSDAPRTAMIVVEVPTQAEYEMIEERLLTAGFRAVNPHEWNTCEWRLSRTSAIDVVDGSLIRFTTGTTSLYTGYDNAPPLDLTPTWIDAAQGRPALLGLVPPGTLRGVTTADEQAAALRDAAQRRQLLGARAVVRFNMPVARPPAPGAPS